MSTASDLIVRLQKALTIAQETAVNNGSALMNAKKEIDRLNKELNETKTAVKESLLA